MREKRYIIKTAPYYYYCNAGLLQNTKQQFHTTITPLGPPTRLNGTWRVTFRNLHTQWLVLPLSTYYNSEHKLPPAKFFSFIRKPPTASIRLSGKPGDVPTTAIFGYLIFCSSSTAMIHTFSDHRLRTHGERRFIVRRSCWPSTCPHPHRPSLPISELLFFKNGDDA